MKNDILKIGGVGQALATRSGETPIHLGLLEGLEISVSGNVTKKHAGTGAYPVATYTAEKEMTVSVDEGLLSLRSVRLTQGDKTVGSTILRGTSEESTVPASPGPYTITVSKASYEAGKMVVQYADGTYFTKVSGAPSAAGEYQETTPGSGIITFDSSDAGEDVVITYVYEYDSSTNSDNLDMLSLEADARACEIEFHYFHSFTDCGSTDLFELMFYQARPTGELAIKFAHADIGDVSGAVLDIEDPLRADNRLGMMALKSA